MFKKLLVVSLVGLTSSLVWAEEKKVTADMLIGKWTCSFNESSSTNYNSMGKIIKQDNKVPTKKAYVLFKKENGKILEYGINNDDNNKINELNSGDASKSEVNINIRGGQVTGVFERNYISDNEFQYIMNLKAKETNKNVVNAKYYAVAICTRVKE